MNKVYSSGLEYRSMNTNELSRCGIGSCKDECIVVPKSVDGKKVISVDSFAFKRNDTIKSIVLPDTVDYIGAEAFAWCRNLDSVNLCGVVQMSERAFISCDSLTSINLGTKLEFIGAKAFAYCS